jgi:hypothetical protein
MMTTPTTDAGWSWEARIAVACVLLLPWWIWVTGLNPNAFWYVVLSMILGCGIGCGLSGLRRGNESGRTASFISLGILIVAALGIVVLVHFTN